MHPFPVTIVGCAQQIHLVEVPPALDAEAGGILCDLAQGSQISAVAVQDIKPLEALAGKVTQDLTDKRFEKRFRYSNRARE